MPALFISAFSYADSCSDSTIVKIPVPYYYDSPASPSFQYSFQVLPSGTPGAPTIIVLPGGPGVSSIGKTPSQMGFPPSFNVIFTDPRGEGCNATTGAPFPNDFFKSEYLAQDILSLIQHQNLTNYYIYGLSFGTVQGTMATSLAEQKSMTPPKALILEGTLGRAFSNYEDFFSLMRDQWYRVRNTISPLALSRIAANSLPGNITGDEWSAVIRYFLIVGDIPGQGPSLKAALDPLGSSDPNTVAAAMASIKNVWANLTAQEGIKTTISQVIFCREITGSFSRFKPLVNNEFVLSADVCPSLPVSFSAPYDAHNYPVTVPIYYFQGEYDPALPFSQMQYHFAQQTKSQRISVAIPKAGHNPLNFSLSYVGCTTALWNSLVFSPANFSAVVEQCETPSLLAYAPARASGLPKDPVIIESINPTLSNTSGGEMVQISGKNFLSGAVVTIGGRSATDVVVTSQLIQAKIPSGSTGYRRVTVINPDGQQASAVNEFQYVSNTLGQSPGLSSMKVYPNPFKPAVGNLNIVVSTPTASSEIKIYTMVGSLVRRLEIDTNGLASWDGKNDSGDAVASGVYIFLMQANHNRITHKIILIR